MQGGGKIKLKNINGNMGENKRNLMKLDNLNETMELFDDTLI